MPVCGTSATHRRSIQQGGQDWQVEGKPLLSVGEGRHFSKPKSTHKLYLTPDELKLFMASEETNGVRETQLAFGFACLTGLRISDIKGFAMVKHHEERGNEHTCNRPEEDQGTQCRPNLLNRRSMDATQEG
jgi:integrase